MTEKKINTTSLNKFIDDLTKACDEYTKDDTGKYLEKSSGLHNDEVNSVLICFYQIRGLVQSLKIINETIEGSTNEQNKRDTELSSRS